MAEIAMWILGAVLVVLGLAGTILPALPGAVLVLAGLFFWAWAEQFVEVSWGTMIALSVIAALTYAVDFLATALGSKRAGASQYAFWGAALGSLVGIFFGLPGLLLGPFVGAVAGELLKNPNLYMAGRAGVGAWVGLLLGTAAKLMLVFLMIGWFITARIF